MLLFIDNIFRFTQAGSEVSALLGRIPSRRRLPADAGHGDGRAAGAHHLDQQGVDHLGAGDLRARRRPDRPGAGDGVRPPGRDHGALARASPSWASTRPSIRSTRRRRSCRPTVVGAEHYQVARQVQKILQRYKELPGHHRHPRHGRAVGGRQADRVTRARKIQKFLSQPFFVAETFTGTPGKYVEVKDTMRSFKEIVDGKCDDIPEQAFYMQGGLDDVRATAEKHGQGSGVSAAMKLSRHHTARRARRHRRRGGHRAGRAGRVRRAARPRAADVGAEAGRALVQGQGPLGRRSRSAGLPAGGAAAAGRRSRGRRDRVLVLVDQAVTRQGRRSRRRREGAGGRRASELAAWTGELDGAYQALLERRGWAQARLDAAARVALALRSAWDCPAEAARSPCAPRGGRRGSRRAGPE